jgi:hypothetical protein
MQKEAGQLAGLAKGFRTIKIPGEIKLKKHSLPWIKEAQSSAVD